MDIKLHCQQTNIFSDIFKSISIPEIRDTRSIKSLSLNNQSF